MKDINLQAKAIEGIDIIAGIDSIVFIDTIEAIDKHRNNRKTMDISNIIKNVRDILDYNEEASTVTGFTDAETLSLDDIISSQIEPAARHLTMIAPKEYVKWSNFSTPTDQTKEPLEINMPSGYIRFGHIKLGGNDGTVDIDTLTDIDSKEYRTTAGEFSGLKPCSQRPIAVITSAGTKIEIWGGKTYGSGSYAASPDRALKSGNSLGTGDSKYDSGYYSKTEIGITTAMEQPLCYAVASYTAEVLKDTQKSNTLIGMAYMMLGLTMNGSQGTAGEQ